MYRIDNEFSPTSESRLLSGRASLEARHIDGGKSPYVYTRDRIVLSSLAGYTRLWCVCARVCRSDTSHRLDPFLRRDEDIFLCRTTEGRKEGKVFFDRLNYTVACCVQRYYVCTRT